MILRRKEELTMKDWKIIAIIAATAAATAAAVLLVLQKQNAKRRMRFDSTEFDEDDYMDDIACGKSCTCCGDDLDVDIPDTPETKDEETAEPAEEPAPAEAEEKTEAAETEEE